EALAPLRDYDRVRYRQGLPWDGRLTGVVDVALTIAQQTRRLLEADGAAGGPGVVVQSVEKSVREGAGLVRAALVGDGAAALTDVGMPRIEPRLEAADADDGAASATPS
ncbi:MAG TPA: hypothetical protein VK989_15590, partial [Polyangia bacterium]|nr:hypothetical protein [Polyangia bacterium]